MSEFFKALEQAERDRQLAEEHERPAPVSRAETPGTMEGAEAGRHQEDSLPEEDSLPAETAAAVPPAAAAPRAPAMAPPPPAPPERKRTSVFGRAPAPVDRPGPRPADPDAPRTERAAPRPLDDRPASRQPSGPAVESDSAPLAGSLRAGKRRGLGQGKGGPVLIADLDPRSVATEAYRTLRVNLELMPNERSWRNVIITSASMGEGKSTTAANLAVVAAQAGTRVCLVDADMRRPALHAVFGFPNRGGFTRALSQAMPLSSVAVATDIPNLSLVVAGSADGLRLAQLLNGPRLQKVLHDPGTPFDLVLFDTPPVIAVADAMNMAAYCDGVVLVVRAGAMTPSVVQQAVRQITQVNGRVLGVLLNQVDLSGGEADFYRYYRAYYSTAKKA